MKKSLLIIIVCALSVFTFQAFTTAPASDWKNLKILPNDISEERLDSIMNHFTASLGVKCTYCHVKNYDTNKMEFSRDDKPEKLIARKMMLMAIDINKNHFQKFEEDAKEKDGIIEKKNDTDSVKYMLRYVTCFTCHQGTEHPENTPPEKEKE